MTIDFYMHLKKCDSLTTARELARRCNIPWEENETPEARKQREQEEERQNRIQQAVNYWKKNLRPEDKEHLLCR
jgi:tRNA(Ile)-lysidine synthase TilS/MesJ